MAGSAHLSVAHFVVFVGAGVGECVVMVLVVWVWVVGVVAVVAVRYLRMSACFLEKSKNLAVLTFAFFFATFLRFLASNFSFLLSLRACCWSSCLSSFLPCRNRFIVTLHWFFLAFSSSGAMAGHFALKAKALVSRGGLALALISLRRRFFAAVASHHSLALAASLSLSTLSFHPSLSCAIAVSSAQLVLSSTSISISPGWR